MSNSCLKIRHWSLFFKDGLPTKKRNSNNSVATKLFAVKLWCHSYSACYMCTCNCVYSLFTCLRDVLASYGDISVMRVYHLKMQGCGGWTWTINCCWFNTSRPTSYYVPAPISHGVVCCVGNMRSPFMLWSRFKSHMLEMCQMWKTICSVISPLSAVARFQCFLSDALTSLFLGQGPFMR